ncbi:MAG: hypothetical protein JSV05_09415 [Candidatus Bathyarchaeota archaeon]|nr:MAG: hypothetical protein JSV05_09415 [Candidatus Bathyarchaeota archaeon]
MKHEEFESIKEATLEHTIKALAGLFILNILHWRNQIYVVRQTDVFYAEYMRREDMEIYLKESMIGVPKSLSHWRIEAKTPLLAHLLRVDESTEGSPLMLDDDNSHDG